MWSKLKNYLKQIIDDWLGPIRSISYYDNWDLKSLTDFEIQDLTSNLDKRSIFTPLLSLCPERKRKTAALLHNCNYLTQQEATELKNRISLEISRRAAKLAQLRAVPDNNTFDVGPVKLKVVFNDTQQILDPND